LKYYIYVRKLVYKLSNNVNKSDITFPFIDPTAALYVAMGQGCLLSHSCCNMLNGANN